MHRRRVNSDWRRSTRRCSRETRVRFTSKVEGAAPRDWTQFVHTRARKSASGSRRTRADSSTRVDDLVKACATRRYPPRSCPDADPREGRRAAPTRPISKASTSASARPFRRRRSCSASSGRRRGTAPDHRCPPRARSPAYRCRMRVEGLDDVMVRLSRCCTPVPGDEIMGSHSVAASRHRTDCQRGELRSQADAIEVEWERRPGQLPVSVDVEGDRSKLCAISPTCCRTPRESSCTSQTQSDRIARLRFEFELADPGHSTRSLRYRADSVYDAARSSGQPKPAFRPGTSHANHRRRGLLASMPRMRLDRDVIRAEGHARRAPPESALDRSRFASCGARLRLADADRRGLRGVRRVGGDHRRRAQAGPTVDRGGRRLRAEEWRRSFARSATPRRRRGRCGRPAPTFGRNSYRQHWQLVRR